LALSFSVVSLALVASAHPPQVDAHFSPVPSIPLSEGESDDSFGWGGPFYPPFSIQAILFVPAIDSFPAGYQPTEAELAEDLANIDAAMDVLRNWYSAALGLDQYLYIRPPVRLDGWRTLAEYEIHWRDPTRKYQNGIHLGNPWGYVTFELDSRGYGPGTDAYPNITVIFCKGAGGFAGGAQRRALYGGGFAMLGDWCLDALAGRIPPDQGEWWWRDRSDQLGAIVHETGHAFGLMHPSAYQDYSVMYAFWDFPEYAPNPFDPEWPLAGLHAWGANVAAGGETIYDYQDAFMLEHRLVWFHKPPFIFGDLNCDGFVDFTDIDPFVLALINPAEYTRQLPNCDMDTADVNDDGAIDFYDIDPFIGALAG
jgi:hypothetical protein